MVDSFSSGLDLFNQVGFVDQDQFSQGKLGQTGSSALIFLSDNSGGSMNSSLDVQVFSVETHIVVALSLFEGSFVLQEVSSALLEAQSDLGQVDLLGDGLGGGDGNCLLLNEA